MQPAPTDGRSSSGIAREPADSPARITVCVCTYRRPDLLRRLLTRLAAEPPDPSYRLTVVVADNDHLESARTVAEEFAGGRLRLVYCVEPEQNIARARNRAVAAADGDYLAFIDDDEFPGEGWLAGLLATCRSRGAAGVLAPVLPHFDTPPPRWVLAGSFFDRPRHATGAELHWTGCRTGNALIARRVFDSLNPPFRAEFGTGGEDQDFFRRASEAGHRFVWCDEAKVYEVVPPHRYSIAFMFKRGLLRGKNTLRHGHRPVRSLATSLVAVPCYGLLVLLGLPFGLHHSIKWSVKLADHAGKLLALVGANPVNERPM